MYGPSATNTNFQAIQAVGADQESTEDRDKVEARAISESNNYLTNMMKNNPSQNTMGNEQVRSALL